LVIASDPVQDKLRESLASRAQQRSWHVQPVSADSLSTEPSVDRHCQLGVWVDALNHPISLS
jgi:hypothetical protein